MHDFNAELNVSSVFQSVIASYKLKMEKLELESDILKEKRVPIILSHPKITFDEQAGFVKP